MSNNCARVNIINGTRKYGIALLHGHHVRCLRKKIHYTRLKILDCNDESIVLGCGKHSGKTISMSCSYSTLENLLGIRHSYIIFYRYERRHKNMIRIGGLYTDNCIAFDNKLILYDDCKKFKKYKKLYV